MAKIRLTKTELKKQKEALKRFTRYLPTLILKKQQLQMEISKIQRALDEQAEKSEKLRKDIEAWIAVFAEDVGMPGLVSLDRVVTEEGNIAGIDIPVFVRAEFKVSDYDLILTPLWVDAGIEAVKQQAELNARIRILEKQLELVREELRTTTQRVNLFEKVMIPEAKENIRRIQIFLGDLQTAAVVTGKIAKENIQKKGVLARQ